jgi:hypothetical protein
MGDHIFKNGLPGGYRTQARNLNNAWFVRLYGILHNGFTTSSSGFPYGYGQSGHSD